MKEKSYKAIEEKICKYLTVRMILENKVSIASFLWDKAANIISGGPGEGWDHVGFYINVRTGNMSIECSKYPNQFGYSPSSEINISAEEFHSYAKKLDMDKCLQDMETKEDWLNVINRQSIKELLAQIDEQHKNEHEEQIEKLSIKIPLKLSAEKPSMDYLLNIRLLQRYGSSSVDLSCVGNQYVLKSSTKSRILNDSEAVWVENQIDKTVNDNDNKVWSSYAGGDMMPVTIKKNGSYLALTNGGQPIRKYFDLLHVLERLVDYGSQIINEEDNKGNDKNF